MVDFIRLFQLSGLLLEEMTPAQAKMIFKSYGARDADLVGTNLKKTRNMLAKQLHPDLGGDPEALKAINAAYDVLSVTPPEPARTEYTPPAWQTDPRAASNNISRRDYSDANYIKMRMWELSNRSRQKYTIWKFDGRFFRDSITVYGSPAIFPEMAKAIQQFDPYFKTRAVFVEDPNSEEKTLSLIWLDGRDIAPPDPMEYDAFNRNPGNDQSFVRRLPAILDRISQNP